MPDVQKNFRTIAMHSVYSGQNMVFIVILPYFWLDLPLACIVPSYEESCKLHPSFSYCFRIYVPSVSEIGWSWKQNLNCQWSHIWLHKFLKGPFQPKLFYDSMSLSLWFFIMDELLSGAQWSHIWLHKRENSSAWCSQEKERAVFRSSARSGRTRAMCIFLPPAKVLRCTGLTPK